LATNRFTQRSAFGEIVLAPAPRAIRLRQRQMQRSRFGEGAFPLPAERLAVAFQSTPDGFPVLRRRLHHHFLHLLFEPPSRQRAQLRRARSKQHPLKRILARDFTMGDDHGQPPLMNVNSCYPVRHNGLLGAGAESVP